MKALRVTIELVDQGTTSEINPIRRGQTYNSQTCIFQGLPSVTIIPNVTHLSGAGYVKATNLAKLIALARDGATQSTVTSALDALSP